jgi:hypothetical protein
MPGALNTQTDRTVRYEQRCLKKRCDDQKKERAERALKRDEISKEVSSHIRSECDKKKRMSSRMKTTTSFVDFF